MTEQATVKSISDLARDRRALVDTAKTEPVRLRDTDGTVLVLTTETRGNNTTELIRLYSLVARALIECRSAHPRAELLDDISYIADWSADDRQDFLDGLVEALGEARRLSDPEPAAFYIRWNHPHEGPVPTLLEDDVVRRLGAALPSATRPSCCP